MALRLALLAAAALVLVGCGSSSSASGPPPPSRFAGTELSPPSRAPDFALRDQNGRTVRLSGLRGKTVFVTFLYTHCPDTCPLIAENLATVLERLGAKSAGVRVLAVSVDPKGDTPAAARVFVAKHRLPGEFHFLLGTRPKLAKVWRAYHIAAEKGPEDIVNHSACTLLVDGDGMSRVLYDAQIRPRDVLHDLRELGSA